MKRALSLVLLLCFVAPVVAQQKKKKSDLPMPVVAAQFVYITSFHGNAYDRDTSAEERAAINRVEDAIRAWGKYKVVYQPAQADLMLVVKPGSVVSARTGIDIGSPPMDPTGTRVDPRAGGIGIGSLGGVDVSSDPNDMLIVSLRPQEPAWSAPAAWRRSARHGLSGNKPALVEAFRDAVTEAARQNGKP